MTEIYCFVDDYLKTHPELSRWRQSPNAEPRLTDSEVITVGLMQSCLGVTTLKRAYQHIRTNYLRAFPLLCSYKQWVARLHRLSEIVGHLVEAARRTNCFEFSIYLMDSKPIPVCKPIRHWSVRLLREAGAYFCKSSKGWFFGFKLHTIFNINGHIVGAVLTAANLHERDTVTALGIKTDGGIVLGDQAYSGDETVDSLADEADLLVITRRHAPEHKQLLSRIRQRIETFLGQLYHLFIDVVYSRSWQGLWSTIKLKMLAYNLRHMGLVSF